MQKNMPEPQENQPWIFWIWRWDFKNRIKLDRANNSMLVSVYRDSCEDWFP